MDLLPSQDQLDIAAAAATILAKELPVAALLERRSEPSAISDSAWTACAETGLLGLGLPEASGGADCGVPEEVLLFREVGRHLAPGPLLTTVLAGHVALACGATELAAGIAAGAVVVAYADPEAGVRADAPELDGLVHVRDWVASQWVLTVTPEGAGLVETAALGAVTGARSIDVGVRIGGARVTHVPFTHWTPDEDGSLQLHGIVLVAAQLVGIAEACRDESVQYAKTREQFGRPIGVNQAIKHACADMAVRAQRAYSQLLFAAASLDARDPDAAFHVHAAKVVASEAARENAAHNLQVHGGMGFTTEFDAHLFVERAEVLEHTYAARHASLAEIITLPAPQ
jgi:alkylation response protein AidB-like acyl-CoA dehydrogenase